jgi:hypothetical protein
MKKDKFASVIDLADRTEPRPGIVVVSRPEHLIKAALPPVEHRTRKTHTYLKPSEYDALVARVGRRSASDALRDLVLAFIDKPRDHE